MILFVLPDTHMRDALRDDIISFRPLLDQLSDGDEIVAVALTAVEPGYSNHRADLDTYHAVYSSAGRDCSKLDLGDSMHNPISNSNTVCWAKYGLSVIVSNSQDALRTILRSKLDLSSIAGRLSSSIPFNIYNRSVWAGIQTLQPGCRAAFSADGTRIESIRIAPKQLERQMTYSQAVSSVDSSLRNSIVGGAGPRGSSLSCDISGGIDSTTIAYYLQDLGYGIEPFHVLSGDQNNRDFSFAKQAAAELMLDLTVIGHEQLPIRSFSTVYPRKPKFIGETLPMWYGAEHHIAEILAKYQDGTHVPHITGIGGDELFAYHFAAPIALLKRGSRSRGLNAISRLAAVRGWSRVKTIQYALNQKAPTEELKTRLHRSGRYSAKNVSNLLGWFPGFDIPSFLDTEVAEELASEVLKFAEESDVRNHPVCFKHVSLDSIWRQSEFIRAINIAFGRSERRLAAPMLHTDVIELFLQIPAEHYCNDGTYKPLLKDAAAGVVPAWLFERGDKGEMSADLFADYFKFEPEIRNFLKEPISVDIGLCSAREIRQILDKPIFEASQLMVLESIVNLEKWLKVVA